MPRWIKVESIKEFFWPTFFLFFALFLALGSSLARRQGQIYAAAFLSVLALIFAAVVCFTLVPRLLAQVRLEFLLHLRFFRLTQRGLFLILVTFILSFATFNTGNNLLILILSALLAAMVVSGVIANLVLLGLKISLNVPDAIHAGQKAMFRIRLANLKRFFPSFALRLKGDSRVKEDERDTDFYLQEKSFPYVPSRGYVSSSLPCHFRRRGMYRVDGFEVKTTFPFGFFWRGRLLDAAGTIVVYPKLWDQGLLLLHHPDLLGTLEENRKGWGRDLYNIRPYQSGDSARHVHWKSTAKRQELMVKDYAREQDRPLSIGFSTYLSSFSSRELEQFEKAVSWVASLACECSGAGRELHFSSGEFEETVDGGPRSYRALMEYLAVVEPACEVLLDAAGLSPPCLLLAAGEVPEASGLPRIDYLQM